MVISVIFDLNSFYHSNTPRTKLSKQFTNVSLTETVTFFRAIVLTEKNNDRLHYGSIPPLIRFSVCLPSLCVTGR